MATPRSLPNEVILTVFENLGGVDRERPNYTLLNAACTCKALHYLAIPVLYKHITVLPRQHLLLPLLYRLLQREDLSNSVQSLTCLQPGLGAEYQEWAHQLHDSTYTWCQPADFRQLLCDRLLDNINEGWIPKRFGPDTVFYWISMCCPKIVELRLSTSLGHFGDHEIFEQVPWPWECLESIQIQHTVDAPADSGGELLGTLLLSMVNSNTFIKHLRCDNLSINWLDVVRDLDATSLDLDSLKLCNVEDEINDDWQTADELIRACRDLKDFQIDFETMKHVNVYNNMFQLLMNLYEHADSLRSICFTYEQADEWPTAILRNLTPHVYDGWNLADLNCLERLLVPVPLLLGFDLFNGKLSEKGVNLDFEDRFKTRLCENLPASIRVLQLHVASSHQSVALASALHGMLEQRVIKFKNLTKIEISFYGSVSEYIESLDSLLGSEALLQAKNDGFQIKFRPTSSLGR